MDIDTCVFCRIVDNKDHAHIVREWYDAMEIVPLNPVVPGHTLVISLQHVADATSYPRITAAVMGRAAQVARSHTASNIITSIGHPATQSIFHLHVHVVPRQEGDGLLLPWSG